MVHDLLSTFQYYIQKLSGTSKSIYSWFNIPHSSNTENLWTARRVSQAEFFQVGEGIRFNFVPTTGAITFPKINYFAKKLQDVTFLNIFLLYRRYWIHYESLRAKSFMIEWDSCDRFFLQDPTGRQGIQAWPICYVYFQQDYIDNQMQKRIFLLLGVLFLVNMVKAEILINEIMYNPPIASEENKKKGFGHN